MRKQTSPLRFLRFFCDSFLHHVTAVIVVIVLIAVIAVIVVIVFIIVLDQATIKFRSCDSFLHQVIVLFQHFIVLFQHFIVLFQHFIVLFQHFIVLFQQVIVLFQLLGFMYSLIISIQKKNMLFWKKLLTIILTIFASFNYFEFIFLLYSFPLLFIKFNDYYINLRSSKPLIKKVVELSRSITRLRLNYGLMGV